MFNPLASPSVGAPALNYGDVNTETTSPGEVKGLNNLLINCFTIFLYILIILFLPFFCISSSISDSGFLQFYNFL